MRSIAVNTIKAIRVESCGSPRDGGEPSAHGALLPFIYLVWRQGFAQSDSSAPALERRTPEPQSAARPAFSAGRAAFQGLPLAEKRKGIQGVIFIGRPV